MPDLVSRRLLFFLLSLAVLVPGIASLLVPPGLKLGIEFTSGSTMTVKYDQPPQLASVRSALGELGYPRAIVQRLGEADTFFLRLPRIEVAEKERLEAGLKKRLGGLMVLDFASVSPIVAREIGRYAVLAVLASTVGILLYIAWAFRGLPKSWRYGVCGIIALVHDALVVMGIFSLLGRFFNVQIDAMFVTAILAVIGYSINDTVIVYDRIRENLAKGVSRDFARVVNLSIWETLPRSINTGFTTLLVLAALFFMGGVTLRYFVLALLVGITAGTYSSIFIAAQLMATWERRQWGGLRPSPR